MFLSRKCHINSDFIKILALVSMTVDHLVKAFDSFQYTAIISNSAGRLAFPIFGFLIALNLSKRGGPALYKKYVFRLLITGLITLAVDYFFGGFFRFNIMFTFLLAVLFIYIANKISDENYPLLQKIPLMTLATLVFLEMSIIVEYDVAGFLYVVLFYFFLRDESKIMLISLLLISAFLNSNHTAMIFTIAITVFLLLFRECFLNKGRIIKKWWMFYMYYPLHKLLIHLI